MFGWWDDDGGSRIFWYQETKAGYQKLVRPDGSFRICKETNEWFADMGPQCLAGWRRARLLIKEYGYWDITAFGATMSTIIGVRTSKHDEDGNPIVYLFSSCENAERKVYPYLSEEQIGICRQNVDDFYKNPNLQAAWHDFILHPICLRVKMGSNEVEPVSISAIGCGQGALGQCHFSPVGSLKMREWIDELFNEDFYE